MQTSYTIIYALSFFAFIVMVLESYSHMGDFWTLSDDGDDGFTKEFYETFFELLWKDLIDSFNGAFQTDKLSVSQRRGIISLIPKDENNLITHNTRILFHKAHLYKSIRFIFTCEKSLYS